MVNLKNTGSIINYIRGKKIILVLLAIVEVVLVLGPPTNSSRKMILKESGIMGGLFHLRVNEQHQTW